MRGIKWLKNEIDLSSPSDAEVKNVWNFPPLHTRMYPKVSGLAAWSKNYKWYSSLPLDAIVSLFCGSVW
jgi:hypothetical protein